MVDRKDLDYQTNQEYDKFSKGSVSSATNTDDLIHKLNDPNVRIIVTTIQKLNNAISGRNLSKMKSIQHERMVLYLTSAIVRNLVIPTKTSSIILPIFNYLALQVHLFWQRMQMEKNNCKLVWKMSA